MEIFRKDEVPTRRVPGDPEVRWYYTAADEAFKIVVTHLPPGHVQNEHRHDHLLDIVYVVEGQIRVYERREDGISDAILSAGDLACFAPPYTHNTANLSATAAITLTLKILEQSSPPLDFIKGIFDRDWIGYDGSPA